MFISVRVIHCPWYVSVLLMLAECYNELGDQEEAVRLINEVRARPSVNMPGLNSVGIARAGIAPANRRSIKQAYRLLYRSGLRLSEAIEAIEQEVESCPEVEHMLQFLRNADRGICRPAGHSGDKKKDDAEGFFVIQAQKLQVAEKLCALYGC